MMHVNASEPTVIQPIIKNSLINFINKFIPKADVTSIDDIVFSYIATIIEETDYDVENFMEMMMGYVPAFMDIEVDEVYNWLVQIENEVGDKKRQVASQAGSAASTSTENLALNAVPTAAQASKPSRNRNSVSTSSEESSEEHVVVIDCPQYEQQAAMLQELFPDTCLMEIKHCITIANGDVQMAASTLLVRRDNDQAYTAAALPTPAVKSRCDDSTLKYRIIERYSYVDRNSTRREHRPVVPKAEPKKLVRYRDGKIVSLKGERYTEVSKSGVEEEHLKKPKKHSP